MNRTKTSSAVPLRIRDACLVGLEMAIPEIAEIARRGETQALKLSAFDKLGKFGLGGRKTVLVENPTVAEICQALIFEIFSPSEAQIAIYHERLEEELMQFGGDEFEEDDETVGDD